MRRFSERRAVSLNKEYQLRYLPVFSDDLNEAVRYIAHDLQNPQAARKLLADTEKAILERQNAPCAYQPYPSVHQREHPYFRINIRNFSAFYVVIGDVMEVRRFLYSKRDLSQLL